MTKEERVAQLANKSVDLFKKSIYDIISASIVLAIVIISLDIFGIKDINKHTLSDLFIEWIPFFLASILLDNNLYEKGKYIGKSSTSYMTSMLEYSTGASTLTGKKLKYFPDFFKDKNTTVKRNKQEQLLRNVGIDMTEFDSILRLSNTELKEKYNKDILKVIRKAKNVKVVGYKVNLILGNYNTSDETNLGPTEEEMSKYYKLKRVISNIISTSIMTILGIKDLTSWGWMGLLIVLFKACYTFGKAYGAYFRGYQDVTIRLVNQINRKTDIFKEYDYWFDSNVENVGNKIENS